MYIQFGYYSNSFLSKYSLERNIQLQTDATRLSKHFFVLFIYYELNLLTNLTYIILWTRGSSPWTLGFFFSTKRPGKCHPNTKSTKSTKNQLKPGYALGEAMIWTSYNYWSFQTCRQEIEEINTMKRTACVQLRHDMCQSMETKIA